MTLIRIKNSKLYRVYAGTRGPDGSELRGTWEEFCAIKVGRDRKTVDEWIDNLETLGGKLYDDMNSLGVSVRNMRVLRQAPEAGIEALQEASQAGDKDAVLELAESLIAKQAQEKARLTKERDDARADAKAKEGVMASYAQERDAARVELRKLKDHIAAATPDERSAEIRAQADAVCMDIQQRIGVDLNAALGAVRRHALEHGLDVQEWLSGQVNQINNTFMDVAGGLGVAITRTGTAPVWEEQQ